MDRRRFVLTSLAGALAAPRAAWAQEARKVHTIAVIFTTAPAAEMTETGHPVARSFFAELRRLGYLEGKNLVVERQSALGEPRRFPEIAVEVVRLNPDVIVVFSTRVALAVKAVTSTIPIVGHVSAPVEEGLAASLGRPGGNFTGVTPEPGGPAFSAKCLSVFHEAVPKVSRVAFLGRTQLWNGETGRVLRETAARLRIGLILAAMDGPFGADQYVKAFRFISQA